MVMISARIFRSFLAPSPAPPVFSVPLPILFKRIRLPLSSGYRRIYQSSSASSIAGGERTANRRGLTKDRSECPDIERRI
jgi:hypothetical protein